MRKFRTPAISQFILRGTCMPVIGNIYHAPKSSDVAPRELQADNPEGSG